MCLPMKTVSITRNCPLPCIICNTDQPENIDFIADIEIIDQIIDWFGGDIRIAKNR